MSNFLNKTVVISLLLCLGGPFLFADQIAVSSFKYLNSNENSTIIDPAEAQDLLNVDITPSGKSVKKRLGYGLYKTVFTPSIGVHGGYHFFDSAGNDVQLWGSSVSLKGIVADATPNTIVSSATVNSTWDCADTQGFSYCVDSNRDAFIKTNGTTLGGWFTSPLGTMVESTPDRVVVAGVSASPNTLFVSQSNTFTNFTTGVNATDAFNEVIASPGSHITHIRWGCQKLLWWKDQSFGYLDFEDQYTAQIKIVSDNIGTFDNTSAIDPGGNVWFRAQDGHTYKYDCSGLSRETVDITPQIQTSGKRTSNLWQQTTQSDFQSGSIVPTQNLSTTISAGDVIVSSFQANEYSNTQWNSGTSSNFVLGTTSISLSVANANIPNNGFESGSANWTLSNATVGGSLVGVNCTLSPRSGSNMLINTVANASVGDTYTLSLKTCAGSTINSTTFAQADNSCSWTARTLSSSGAAKKSVKIVLEDTTSGVSAATSDCFLNSGTDITIYTASDKTRTAPPPLRTVVFDDITDGSSTITSGYYTSPAYNTGFTSSTFQLQGIWTVNAATPTFSLLTSTGSTGPWTSLLTSTATNGVGNKFVIYTTSLSVVQGQDALTAISSFTLLSRSSGTYYSAVKNAPNLTGWSTFNPTTTGDGTHTFYMRSSSNSFTVLSATPVWTAQSANSLVVVTTYTYFQVRDDFSLSAATQTPTLNDFTLNWFEGSASDQAYMLFFENAIWESVAYGSGVSSNTYVFRYDLINNGWGLYNFGAGGMLIQGNKLYFGSVGDGNVFQFGSGASDNGTAMTSYWRSKSFVGPDAFLQNQLTNVDIFAKKDSGSTLTSTYTLDTSTATAYSIALSTSSSIIQSRKLLPSGKLGYTFDIKLGDSSTSSQWEVLGIRMGYTQLPYKPSTP